MRPERQRPGEGVLDDDEPAACLELDDSGQFFFALLALTRFPLNIGLIDRPLAAGLLWGLGTGHWELALGVGLFFELLWLDLFHAGTYIPPNGPASVVAAICLAEIWSFGSEPGLVALCIALAIPIGLLGPQVEYAQRRWQNAGYNALLHWSRHSHRQDSEGILTWLSLRSVGQLAVVQILYFLCATSLAWVAGSIIDARQVFMTLDLPLTWPLLWFSACVGAVLALRVRRAYAVLLLGLLLLTLWELMPI